MTGNLGSFPPRVKRKISIELSRDAYRELILALKDAGFGDRVKRDGTANLNDVTISLAEPQELDFHDQ